MRFYIRHKIAIWTSIAILFLIMDRLLKHLAQAGFFKEPVYLIKGIFSLKMAKNYYIALSIPWMTGVLLNVLTLLIIIGLLYYLVHLYKTRIFSEYTGLLLLLILGAVSNFADRIQEGFVIDYLHLKYFTVFNVADVMIVAGALGLIWFNLRSKKTS